MTKKICKLKKLLRKPLIDKPILKKVAQIKSAKFFRGHFQTTFSCSLKQKHIDYELNKAEKHVNYKQKPKKKKIGNLILLIVNFCIIAGIFIYFYLTSGTVDIYELFSLDLRWTFLLVAVLMLLMTIIIEALRYAQLIYKSTGKFRFFLSLKTHLLGKYYDNITPFAAGGQPFQIFYLNKKGVKGDKATSIPLTKHVITVATSVLIGLFVIVYNLIKPLTSSGIILALAVIACAVNLGLISLILLLSISKKIGPALVIKCLKLLNKLKIIKNYKATFFKVNRFVKNYQKSMRQFTKSLSTIIIQFVLSFLGYLSWYAIVYFIYLAFLPAGITPAVSFLDIFMLMTLCDLCSSVMPLPGGSGLAEISFDQLFRTWFVAGLLPWALLSWRTLTYFVFIIIGGILIFSTYIKSTFIKKREERKNKK